MGGRVIAGVLLVAGLLLFSAPAQAKPDPLQHYAEGTWASFVAMTDPQSGLPADMLNADGSTSVQTSPTNIGAYLWSAVSAERLHALVEEGKRVVRLTAGHIPADELAEAGVTVEILPAATDPAAVP